jgi:maleate isomerase
LIVPSVNRMTEPQFNRYAPAGIAIHVTRVQMIDAPLTSVLEDVGCAARMLADTGCDPVVFHCTGTSMAHGLEGEARLVERVRAESGAECFSTAKAILEAMESLGMRRVVLLSPYSQPVNDQVKAFLAAFGVEIVHDEALDAHGRNPVPLVRWIELARQHAGISSDGYFLSCTNTNQIEAIDAIEGESGRPVVNSNQAVLWAALQRIAMPHGVPPIPGLGRLFAGSSKSP